jgi:hypothetical protein
MRKSATRSLRSLLTASEPIRRLPVGVVRQLVGYYGDWRRSRDIMNNVDEAAASHSIPRLLMPKASMPGSSNSYRAQ